MRKILIFLACVSLVVTMAVPAFADSPTYYVSGQWMPNDSFTNISWDGVDSITNEYDVNVTMDIDGYPVYIYKIGFTPTTIGGSFTIYVYIDGVEEPDQIYPATDTATELDVTFNFGSAHPVHKNLYDWLLANGTFDSCDGSSCPATDVNADGICDDCGLMLMRSVAPALPTLDSLKANVPYYHYLIYRNVDSNTGEYIATRLSFLSSNSPMTVTKAEFDRLNDSAWGGVNFRFTGESDIDGVNYISHDGGQTWEQETTFSNGTSLFGVDENIIASTFNLYDSETGDLFFPLPLWVEMEQVTQGELPNLMQTTGGTITTLVLCGVGLMALLVVLALFGKRSLIYRS